MFGRHPSPTGFRRWVRNVRPDGEGAGGPPNQRWQRYGSYSLRAYAADEQGQLLVNSVIRLESIEKELPRVLDAIGIPGASEIVIPRINTRKHLHYPSFYDAQTEKYVAQMYAEDIDTFGYRFGR